MYFLVPTLVWLFILNFVKIPKLHTYANAKIQDWFCRKPSDLNFGSFSPDVVEDELCARLPDGVNPTGQPHFNVCQCLTVLK